MSATKILWGQIVIVLMIVLAAIWTATQWTAWRLGFQPQLGPPWFHVWPGMPVYLPPAFFWWWLIYDVYAPRVFFEGGCIAASGGFLAAAAAFGLSIWRARDARPAETYGVALANAAARVQPSRSGYTHQPAVRHHRRQRAARGVDPGRSCPRREDGIDRTGRSGSARSRGAAQHAGPQGGLRERKGRPQDRQPGPSRKSCVPLRGPGGSVIPAALITGIRSDLPGQVTAQVTENVYDSPTGQYLLIPQGRSSSAPTTRYAVALVHAKPTRGSVART